jgi:hypothetical protein
MAKNKKTGGRDWKPGESGNPHGSPGLPQELKDARKLNVAEVTELLTRVADMSPADFEAYTPKTMLEKTVIKALKIAADDGSIAHLSLILDRTIGKVKDKLEVTLPKPFIVKRQDGTEVVMGAELQKKEGDE